MNDIFLSYRRSDVAGYVGRLSDALRAAFGEHAVYRDVDSERAGKDWKKSVTRNVSGAEIVLAMIGPAWPGLLAERDTEAEDWTRFELQQARALDIPVIPVLLDGCRPEDLGDLGALAWLSDLQMFRLEDGQGRWEAGVQQLLKSIEGLTPLRACAPAGRDQQGSVAQSSTGDQSPNVVSGGGAININFGDKS